MSYTKNTWQPGDVITSEKLNHLEGGVEEAAPIIFHVEMDVADNAIIVEDPEIIKAAYGKVAMIEVPLDSVQRATLPLAWVTNSTDYPTMTIITAQYTSNTYVVIFGYANMNSTLGKYTVTVQSIA